MAEYVPPICIMLPNSLIVAEIYSYPFLQIFYLAGVLMCNLLYALPVGLGENRGKLLWKTFIRLGARSNEEKFGFECCWSSYASATYLGRSWQSRWWWWERVRAALQLQRSPALWWPPSHCSSSQMSTGLQRQNNRRNSKWFQLNKRNHQQHVREHFTLTSVPTPFHHLQWVHTVYVCVCACVYKHTYTLLCCCP